MCILIQRREILGNMKTHIQLHGKIKNTSSEIVNYVVFFIVIDLLVIIKQKCLGI